MNPETQSLPSFKSLYFVDLPLRRSAKLCVAGLVLAAGMMWLSPSIAAAPASADRDFDMSLTHYATLAASGMIFLGLILLVRRYLLVKRILTQGNIIPAMVDDLEAVEVRQEVEDSPISRTVGHSYYAWIRYTYQGEERTVRLRLPSSGFVFGLAKNHETQVLLLDSKPSKPLIRSVYLGRA
jgi:hypothetical protein